MKRPSRGLLLRLAAMGVLVSLPYVILRIPAARGWVVGFVSFVRTAGPIGALALLGFDAAWALIGAPFWVMGTVAGYAYGFPLGVAVGVPVTAVAMCASFLLGRFVVTRVLPPREVGSARLEAVRRAVETDGRKITMLLRMTPLIPQNVLTYVLATTRLRMRDFAPATVAGIIPFTAFYAYVGSLVQDAAALLAGETPDLGAARWVALGGGLLGGGVALAVIGRAAQRALAKSMEAT